MKRLEEKLQREWRAKTQATPLPDTRRKGYGTWNKEGSE